MKAAAINNPIAMYDKIVYIPDAINPMTYTAAINIKIEGSRFKKLKPLFS